MENRRPCSGRGQPGDWRPYLGRGQPGGGRRPFNRSQGDRRDRAGDWYDSGAQDQNSRQQTFRGRSGMPGAHAHARDVRRPASSHDSSTATAFQEPLTYGRLVKKATAEPYELLLELTSDSNSPIQSLLMNDRLYEDEPDFVDVLLRVLCRALDCQVSSVARIRLVEFLSDRGSAFLSRAVRERLVAGREEPPRLAWPAVRHYLTIAESVMMGAPSNGWPVVEPVIREVRLLMGDRTAAASAAESDAKTDWQMPADGEDMLSRVERLIDDAIEHSHPQVAQPPKQMPHRIGKPNRDRSGDDAQPPEDFRTLTILPTLLDLQPTRPYLRANKTEGSYDDCEHYLDVQFRLLREDFMAPLRNGVQQYIEMQRIGMPPQRLTDIIVYSGVSILCAVPHKNGVVYKIRFDTSASKHVMKRLAMGRCLMFGSLLCLSADNYNTIYVATVADVDAEEIKRGELLVKFEGNAAMAIHGLDYSSMKFTMVESAAFFESYRHILEGLKEVDAATLPFQRYIVDCSRADARPPAYMPERAACKYNLTCLDSGEQRVDIWNNPLRAVAVLSPAAWPDAKAFHLDESQMAALKLALTSEFSLIQGPPGTGKTFIGLKIVQVLLANQSTWQARRLPRTVSEAGLQALPPILIVCYTNHALDQFLEGIMDCIGEGIVRIGGQSRSARMKSVSIASLRAKRQPQSREARNRLRFLQRTHRNRCKQSETLARQAAEADTKLLSCSQLQHVMRDRHSEQLLTRATNMHGRGARSPAAVTDLIEKWLDVENSIPDKPVGTDEAIIKEDHMASTVSAGGRTDDVPEVKQEKTVGTNGEHSSSDDDDDYDMDQFEFLPEGRDRKLEDDDIGLGSALSGERDDNEENLDEAASQGGEADDEGFIKVTYKRRLNPRRLIRKLGRLEAMNREEEDRVFNVWKLSPDDRWRLYAAWIGRHRDQLREKLSRLTADHDRDTREMEELRMQRDIEILRSAKVIGLTTTGAAKYRFIIQQIMPRVVVVEEAAEVLEAHIVASLSPGCEHLILIGDHMQLRPSTTVYELARDYKLEISLFERMVKNNVPFQRLVTQHRMRPEISAVMRHIYPDLIDHVKVKKYDDIKGMKHNAFFLTHTYNEDSDESTLSHRNQFEASFVVALYVYLLQQGYAAEQITILTAYNGQVQLLRELLHKCSTPNASGVRVTSVDNYQGEENDIVLLSMVRSNPEGKLGFTNNLNRICVALSRARKGLYVFGDFEMLSSRSELWEKICKDMTHAGRWGQALELVCTMHGRTTIVEQAADFEERAREGGCSAECGVRLACGHKCSRSCHPFLSDHDEIKCQRPCQRVFEPCRHRCIRVCSADCGDYCSIPIPRLLLCGHTEPVPCGQPVDEYICLQKCEEILDCGHACSAQCGQPCVTNCSVEITRLYACGHPVKTMCCENEEVVPCPEPCGAVLLCGHTCAGTCGACKQGRLHEPCSQPCRRVLVCGHECEASCCDSCPPCQRPCETRCFHSKCPLTCGDPCVPCIEKCEWRCDHYKCPRLCHEPCSRPRCNAPCRRQVTCSECNISANCIGLCGEPCLPFCRHCAVPDRIPLLFGDEHERTARYVLLDDCGHMVEVTGMDRWMTDSQVAASADDGSSWAAAAASPGGQAAAAAAAAALPISIKPRVCPYCKTVVRRSLRYGVLVNDMLENVEEVKALIRGDDEEFRARLADLRTRTSSSVASMLELRQRKVTDRRHLQVLEFQVQCLSVVERLLNECVVDSTEFVAQAKNLKTFVLGMGSTVGAQQQHDAHYELCRLDGLALLARAEDRLKQLDADSRSRGGATPLRFSSSTLPPLPSTQVAELHAAVTLASSLLDGKLDREKLRKFENIALPVLRKHGGSISTAEKEMIMKAMSFERTGHWYKCANGHIYCIGECGGAMEEGTCPECKCKIGGRSHKLLDNNTVASEMDGATHPAWSDANNLNPYLLDE